MATTSLPWIQRQRSRPPLYSAIRLRVFQRIFPIVDIAQSSLIYQSSRCLHLAGKSALETHASEHPVLIRGLSDSSSFLELIGHWPFQYDMFLGLGRGYSLSAKLARTASDGNHIYFRIVKQVFNVLIRLNRSSMLGV